MNESTARKEGSCEAGLKAVHKQWALVTRRKLRLIHPELAFTLYEAGRIFTIHVANCVAGAFAALVEEFDRNIRPVTCHIILTQQTPRVGAPIEETNDYGAELWLNGEPLSVRDFNILLWLAQPNLPAGGIDFDNTRDTWVFRSFTALTEDERICVENAARRAGMTVPIGTSEAVVDFPKRFSHLINPFFHPGLHIADGQGEVHAQVLDIHNAFVHARDAPEWKPIAEKSLRLYSWDTTAPLADVFLMQFGGYSGRLRRNSSALGSIRLARFL